MNLPLPDRAAADDSSILSGQLSLLAGTESARQNMMRSVLTGELVGEVASESEIIGRHTRNSEPLFMPSLRA